MAWSSKLSRTGSRSGAEQPDAGRPRLKAERPEKPNRPRLINGGGTSPSGRTYPDHPAAAGYPDITGSEFDRIVEDIRGGQVRTVTIFEGHVLDGRAAYRAYQALKMAPKFEFIEAKDCPDPVAFVHSRNSVRRQLGRLQLACIAVKEEAYFRSQATARKGKVPDAPSGRKRHETEWATQAAQAHGAGINAVRDMAKIDKTHPDVFEACWRGLIRSRKHARHLRYASGKERARVIEHLVKNEGVGDPLRLLQEYARTHTRMPKYPASDARVLYRGDAETIAMSDIRKGSVDLILTDPPWNGTPDPSKLWAVTSAEEAARKLTRIALHCLKPGGTMAALVGNTCGYTFENAFRQAGLFHRWSMAYIQVNGGNTWGELVQKSQWRPLLLYTAHLPHSGRPLEIDTVKSKRMEKTLHPWQQSEDAFLHLVELLSDPGQVILDPFMGSGTTGAAALKASRKFIGIDADPESFKIAAARLSKIEPAPAQAAE